MSDPAHEDELERLRRENRTLDEQVMLLVRTEQRFYRTQAELDAQLERLQALLRFALDSAGAGSPGAILTRVLGVVHETLQVDVCAVVRPEDARPGLAVLCRRDHGTEPEARVSIDADTWAWLGAVFEPVCVEEAEGPRAAAARDLARALLPDAASEATAAPPRLACVPLRSASEAGPGLLVALARPRRGGYPWPPLPSERELPYLQLLANHADRAIENARLTENLLEHGERLASSLATLERTQAELLQAQKLEAVGRLAGGVAHDFNNMLTVILGYAATLSRTLPAGSPEHQNVGHILEAAQRAAETTRQLLALGRRQMQRRESFDLGEQAGRTVDLLRRLIGEHIHVRLGLDPGGGMVRADRAQIEQVMLNLIVNARDAMPEGGIMRVRTRSATAADAARCETPVDPEAYAVFEVEDDGVGMDEAIRGRIFEPFFTTKGPGRGTGLGLAVVYGIVKQSDGHILVDSAPGRGARFTVLLPREAAASAPAEAAVVERAGPLTHAVILVVEDEAVIRDVVAAHLRAAGHVVHLLPDGEQALEWIVRQPLLPDLVLTDVVMPRLGGTRLAEELRRVHPDLRIAFMSGYAGERVRGARSEEPAGPVLAKPFTPAELLAFVDGALVAPRAPSPRP